MAARGLQSARQSESSETPIKEVQERLRRAAEQSQGATVFGYWVKNPQAFGVVEFDAHGAPIGLAGYCNG